MKNTMSFNSNKLKGSLMTFFGCLSLSLLCWLTISSDTSLTDYGEIALIVALSSAIGLYSYFRKEKASQ
ncbi:hypothetical protein [Motilimonas eburnea]|uniref:hypothetical protein n=1 Tax=Motilimonas eburnea TaxID=1737488 RepID=UPI001E287163|nr:hypothetical protein [Motilimonas eburnea]MCE2571738.1 hypothetical protein [Motilimonas eburnea]